MSDVHISEGKSMMSYNDNKSDVSRQEINRDIQNKEKLEEEKTTKERVPVVKANNKMEKIIEEHEYSDSRRDDSRSRSESGSEESYYSDTPSDTGSNQSVGAENAKQMVRESQPSQSMIDIDEDVAPTVQERKSKK